MAVIGDITHSRVANSIKEALGMLGGEVALSLIHIYFMGYNNSISRARPQRRAAFAKTRRGIIHYGTESKRRYF